MFSAIEKKTHRRECSNYSKKRLSDADKGMIEDFLKRASNVHLRTTNGRRANARKYAKRKEVE